MLNNLIEALQTDWKDILLKIIDENKDDYDILNNFLLNEITLFNRNPDMFPPDKLIFSAFNKFNIDNANFEDRLYFLSSTIIIFCYFFFSNFLYREIFFLGLLPLILLSRKTEENKILSFYFYLIIAKFLLTTIFVYLYQNYNSSMLKPSMIFLKHTLDFYLIFLVLRLYMNIIVLFFRKIFLKIYI